MISRSLVLAVVFLAFVPTTCIAQGLSKLRALVDSRPIVIIETQDASAILEQFEKLDFGQHPRWENLIELVTHPEFGRLGNFSPKILGDIKKQVVDTVLPSQLIFSVDRKIGNIEWQVLIKSKSEEPEKAVRDLFKSITKIQLKAALDLGEETTAIEDCKIVSNVEGIKIYCFSQFHVHWFSHDRIVVLTGSLEKAERLAQKCKHHRENARSINDSRVYRGIANLIQQRSGSRKIPAASLSIQIDPSLVASFLGFLDEKEVRAWGLNEVVGIGLSLNVFESNKQNESKLVVNGFVKSTEPRLGIADAIRLKGMPKQLPSLPKDLALFAFVNFDYHYFHEQKKLLFEKAFGEGSYSKFKEGGRKADVLLGESHRNNFALSLGDLHGVCWYTRNSNFATSYFCELKDSERFVDTIENMTTKLSIFDQQLGYLKDEILGHVALLTRPRAGSKKLRYGYLLKQGWLTLGSEDLLKTVAENDMADMSDELQEMVNELQGYVAFENEPAAVVATWPTFWDVIKKTAVNAQLRKNLQRRIKSGGVNPAEFRAEYDKVMRDVESFEVGTPKSKKECAEFVQFEFSRIVLDSFQKTLVLATSKKEGFRVAAMTFRLPKE